jgi:hypothetical protein
LPSLENLQVENQLYTVIMNSMRGTINGVTDNLAKQSYNELEPVA